MTAQKKMKRIAIILGLILILVSVLVIVVTAKTDHYTATVTEITKTYRTRATGNRSIKRNNEEVTVIFVNGDGEQSKAKGVRIKRSSETQLPEVGETIEVTDGLTGVKEYRALTAYTSGGTMIVVGILIIFLSFRVGRKDQKEPESGETPPLE